MVLPIMYLLWCSPLGIYYGVLIRYLLWCSPLDIYYGVPH